MADQESELTPGLIVPGFHDLWEQIAAVKAKFPHIKINLSVGGYKAEFTDTADSPERRGAFIANVCDWLEKYDLDGVDIDWEYPVGPDWGQDIKSKSADRRNYIALLTEIRTALDVLGQKTGKRYGLSSAVPASGWFVEKNSVVAASKIVDALKLMAYDYYGGWSKNTGHHANLYRNTADPEWGGWSTNQAVNAYVNAGVAPEKIILGVPFYGRAWSGVPDNGTHGLYQPYEKTIYNDGLGWDKIQELLKEGSGFTRYWDDVAKAPFLYNGDIFITYSDEEAINLLNEYVKNRKLGGVFTWEYAFDVEADLLKILAEGAQ
jgi:chitinase